MTWTDRARAAAIAARKARKSLRAAVAATRKQSVSELSRRMGTDHLRSKNARNMLAHHIKEIRNGTPMGTLRRRADKYDIKFAAEQLAAFQRYKRGR